MRYFKNKTYYYIQENFDTDDFELIKINIIKRNKDTFWIKRQDNNLKLKLSNYKIYNDPLEAIIDYYYEYAYQSFTPNKTYVSKKVKEIKHLYNELIGELIIPIMEEYIKNNF